MVISFLVERAAHGRGRGNWRIGSGGCIIWNDDPWSSFWQWWIVLIDS